MTPTRIVLILAAALLLTAQTTIFHRPGSSTGGGATGAAFVVGYKPALLSGNRFTLSAQTGSLACYLNGERLSPGDDFTWNSSTNLATPTTGSALAGATGSDILLCDYAPK